MALSPYLEDLDSQIPAIQVLNALGWKYGRISINSREPDAKHTARGRPVNRPDDCLAVRALTWYR